MKRFFSILTALALCLNLCPTWAFAAEPDPALCPHHWEHTGECGYVAPTEGQPCGHQHTDECYAEETHCVHVHDETCYSDGQLPGEGEEKTADACTHECTADTGCVTRTLDCHHSHDSECGYVPADPGQPCGFVCRLCPIEDLIAALPDEVTADNAEEVRAWLDEILALFGALTGDEQELVDITPCLTLQEQLDAASAASPLADTITLNSRITINSGNLNQYNNKVITGATTKDHLTISGVTINLTIKDLSIQLPYSGDVNSGLVHAGIKLENNATLNLTLEGTNTIKGGSMNAAINVPAGCTLTISGSGSLTARGGDGSAGIGANFGRQSGIMTVGTININGGTIDAYGSSGGAGIGGTLRGSTGRVVINGGTVYAEGSGYSANMGTALSAAGIGGGSMGKLESITITGGTVTARGHKVSDAGNTSASAGIGAGTGAYAYDDGVRDCGDITITGGTIDAKGGGDYAIGFGANSGNQTGGSIQVSGSPSINMNGGKMKPVPGDYILCELKVTIYDRSIVSDQSATLSYGCASWTGTLKKSNSEPYCGTLTASNLLVKGSGSPTLTVEAGGKTWTKEVSPQPNCSVIIGNQDYQKYSLTGTIYDGRITGAMTAASVTINGETHQVTLTRKDCQVSFSLPNLGAANASGAFPVTVTAGGITWTGTTSGGSNKTLTIGTRLQKVRLNFWDSAINRNISVQAQVSRRGSPLGASETVNDGTLHRTQNGNGYLEIWMVPGEDTTISVTVPGLNGGQAIEKTGLTIEARDMELDWYRGVSSDTPALDLSKGPITFDGSRGSLSVTYSDGTGKQHTQSNLSYDALHVITQSDSAATGNYIVVKNLTQQLHIQVNGIHIDRNTDKDPSINVEANCTVELQTEGENTVAGKLHHAPVSVDPSATLILGGTGTLTVENRLERLAMSGAAIGGKSKQDSGKIIIESGTVVATSRGGGAAIGGGDTKKGTVEIRGGTVKATANKYGAAIGGGYQGAGTVKISGGQVNATVSGDASAIGGGTNGNGTVEISGGIVKATANGNGAAIGGGSRGAGTVEISGGRVEVTAKSGAAIGGGYQGAGTVKISGGQVNATVSGDASAIGGGTNGNGTVEISGGIVKATANENGAAIGGGDRGAGTVEISGGTITASSNRGDDVGNGASGSDGSVTITGGSIKTKKKQVLSPTNGSVDVSLVEITLPEGAVPADTAITSAEYYGVKDVYPLDGNKLYFYLPQDERPTIKVGDVDYVPDSPGSTNYIAALSVTLKDYPQSKAYDGNPVENPTTTQVSSSTAYDEMTFTWYQNGTLLSDKPVNAGSYALRVSNAQGIYRDFAVEVTKRPLTITAQAQTIDYGTEIAQDRYTASGLAAGDAVGSISLSADQTTTGTHSGAITISSAQIMRGGVDVTENYDITYEPGDLTINQIACTVSSWPTAAGITYGQALGDSALTGGDANGIFAWKDSTAKPSAGTSEYDVVFTPTDSNYKAVTGQVSVTVQKAALKVKANDQTITYGGSIQTGLDQVTASGLCNGDTLTDVTVSASAKNAGTYQNGITVTGAGITRDGEDTAANYVISYEAGKLIISPLTITVTPNSGQKKEYGASDPVLTYTFSPSLIGSDQLSGSLAYAGENVGAYEITMGTLAAPSENYTLTITPNVMFEITKPSLENATVSLSANSYTYDGFSKAPTVTVTKGGSTVDAGEYDISYSNTSGGIGDHTQAGTVTVTVTAKADGNYSGANSKSTFIINPKELTPTISGTTTKVYDGKTDAPADISISLPNIIESDDVSATASTYTYDSADAGSRTITANGIALSGSAAGNYKLTSTSATTPGAITKAAVSINWDNTAQTSTYSGTQVEITAPTISSESGVTISVLPKYSYAVQGSSGFTDNLPSNAGTYTVRASVAESDNLAAAHADMTLTISKAPLTIASATVASKPYDAAKTATVSGVTFTGLVNGETLAPGEDYTASGEFADANAGTGKSVTVTVVLTSAKANNYNLTNSSVNATGTITKADSSITKAPTATGITYGQALSDSALTNGEGSVAGAFTWADGTIKPNAGTAQFSVTFTPNDTNYNTATADVSVTIAKATPTLTAPTASAIEYGQKLSDSALTGGTASNPNGNAAVAGSWSWANGNTQPTATGTFPVAFVPGDATNYNTPANVDASVTVNPAAPKITLTATPAQQIAGGKVTVDCTVKNPHDAAFSDSLPDASLTYRIGSGAEQALTGDGFNIPAGTAVGTVITITAATTAVDGKYTPATRTAAVTVTDKTPVTISGVRAQDGTYVSASDKM